MLLSGAVFDSIVLRYSTEDCTPHRISVLSRMSFLVPPRQFDPDIPELMDVSGIDEDLLEEDLRNLRKLNRYFGGIAAVRKHILPMFERIQPDREITILDLACGSGDHPVALVHLARSIGRRVKIRALDKNPKMIAATRRLTAGFAGIEVHQADILGLHGQEWHSDIVLCSLALHHFSEADAVRIIRNMKAFSRVGFIINEINRNLLAAWCAWTYTHLTTRNRITLNDTYASFRRAFTANELLSMAERADVERCQVHHEPLFRILLTGYVDAR